MSWLDETMLAMRDVHVPKMSKHTATRLSWIAAPLTRNRECPKHPRVVQTRLASAGGISVQARAPRLAYNTLDLFALSVGYPACQCGTLLEG